MLILRRGAFKKCRRDMQENDKILIFNSRDELLRVRVSKIVYFEADGNYTHIVLANKLKSSVLMNLNEMVGMLAAQLLPEQNPFMRIGRSYIINMSFIYQINLLQQRLVLSDLETFSFQLNISKEALKKVKILELETKK